MEEKSNIAAEGKEEIFSTEDYKRIVENLLFITDRPLSAAKISQVAQINNIQLTKDIVNTLAQEYVQSGRAIQIVELGGGFQMSTKPEYGRWVRALFNEKSSDKLSPAALETLAIIAYKQPVTRAEIETIRGVDIVAPLEKIMERGLVRVVGRKDAPGKPMVYGTTDEFLRLFGLNHISQLPELKTFESKGPKEIQSDLPFGPSLPQVKDNILTLEDDGDIYTRNAQDDLTGDATPGLPDSGERNEQAPLPPKDENTQGKAPGDEPALKPQERAEAPVPASSEQSVSDGREEEVLPDEAYKRESGLEEDMLKEGFEELK